MQELAALFEEVQALEGTARAAWLTALRERDPTLAAELEAMLRRSAGDSTLIGPAAAPAAPDGTPPLPSVAAPQVQPIASHAPQAGRRMGPWRLLRKIGEGGMGQVWLAQRADGLYDAQAAIKLLRSDLTAAGLAGRFARERAVLARLNHPAVARLLDAGIEGGQAYLVLEHVDGRSLADHVRHACPTTGQRVQLLMRIGEAVDHAHAQLIVHRDLKPSNVLVTRDGEPKLLDFGIAALLDDGEHHDTDLTRQTGRGLTLGYAAPEQILGAPIGTATDVFALGVILFELLSGELPFAPRGTPRMALERAVLHDEPRRLSAVLAGPTGADVDGSGPGRPSDPGRVRGDLEAIVAKALRKEPAARYSSVRALLDDLARWRAHRPVTARRDDWRHRSGLWLRRNALVSGALLVVVVSLSAGLAAATWQWRRAEQAARQSDQVTAYLTDLLASASPDRHGGSWPTVLQLLDSSRQALPETFRDDPDTRLRLLEVLATTYHAVNRFDIAIPLQAERVALSTTLYGAEGRPTLRARIDQARSFQVQGMFDKAIPALEPLRDTVHRVFGDGARENRDLLYILSTSYARAGRLDEADRMLGEVGRITERLFAPGSPERLSHWNHVQVLRAGQGRLREALAALRETEPYWGDTRPENARQQLVLRRNMIAIQIRLAEYDRIEERARALLLDMDRLLGPGNDMASGLRVELARWFTEVGQLQRALDERLDILARAQAAKVDHPGLLLPMRVAVLLARAQAHAADAATLQHEARVLLDEMDAQHAQLGYARADAWIAIARVGLLLDDANVAGSALGRLHADGGLQLDRDVLLASRVTQLDGELARLRGDLPRSRALLQERMKVFDRPGEARVLPAWVAALDLAYTLVLAGDTTAATAALERAAARRPPGSPSGHPLDAVTAYLRARLAAGSDAGAAVLGPLQQLKQAQNRPADRNAGLGSLGGAFI